MYFSRFQVGSGSESIFFTRQDDRIRIELIRIHITDLESDVEGFAARLDGVDIQLQSRELSFKKTNHLVGFLLVRVSGGAVFDLNGDGSFLVGRLLLHLLDTGSIFGQLAKNQTLPPPTEKLCLVL